MLQDSSRRRLVHSMLQVNLGRKPLKSKCLEQNNYKGIRVKGTSLEKDAADWLGLQMSYSKS